MSTTISPLVDRDEWLAERRKGIGASEAAAALGLDPYRSPIELWAIKTGKVEPSEPGEAAYWGNEHEPAILRRYESESGNKIAGRQVFVRHPSLPIFATLDAVDDTDTPVECKTIDRRARAFAQLGPADTQDIPETWYVQVQIQMYLAFSPACHVAVLISGNEFRLYTIDRNQAVIDAALPRLKEFWALVESVTPPPFLHADPRVLQAIYDPTSNEIEGDESLRSLVDEYEEHGRIAREANASRDTIKAAMLARLEGNNARLPDGRKVVQSRSYRHEYTVRASEVTTLRILKARES
jgi:putative phage-type endonuclease